MFGLMTKKQHEKELEYMCKDAYLKGAWGEANVFHQYIRDGVSRPRKSTRLAHASKRILIAENLLKELKESK